MSSADARRRALEEHVLDEVRDAAALGGLVPRPARQPDADADGAHVRHRLGEETKAVVENVSDDHGEFDMVNARSRTRLGIGPADVPQTVDRQGITSAQRL